MEPTTTDPTNNDRPSTAGIRAGGQPAAEPPPITPAYSCVNSWVENHFVPMFKRSPTDFRWCARWWQHAEAISRLTALWFAWEAMRFHGPTGISNWYRDHLDHQLPILLGADGPFYQCTEIDHVEPRPACLEPRPPVRSHPHDPAPTAAGADCAEAEV